MQRPVGYSLKGGEAQLTSVGDLLTNTYAFFAFGHTMLVRLTAGSLVVLGVACWPLARGRNVEVFRRAAAVALVVAVPVTAANMVVGGQFGHVATDYQPMKIAAAEALWNTQQPAGFSLIQIGGFSKENPDPSFEILVPDLLSFLSTGSFRSKVLGLNQLQSQYEKQYGRGTNYIPPVRPVYWAMRVMAYSGALMVLVALLGAWLYRRGKLATTRWYLRTATAAIALPFIAATAGWVLTEVGRQPWIVQGLLKTADANSPSVSASMLWVSLAAFGALYAVLAVVDLVLL